MKNDKNLYEGVTVLGDARDKDANGSIFFAMTTPDRSLTPCKIVRVEVVLPIKEKSNFTHRSVIPSTRINDYFINCFLIKERIVLVTDDYVTFINMNLE